MSQQNDEKNPGNSPYTISDDGKGVVELMKSREGLPTDQNVEPAYTVSDDGLDAMRLAQSAGEPKGSFLSRLSRIGKNNQGRES